MDALRFFFVKVLKRPYPLEQRATIDEVHNASRRCPHSNVISDGGTDFRVVGVCNCVELIESNGPVKHDEAQLL